MKPCKRDHIEWESSTNGEVFRFSITGVPPTGGAQPVELSFVVSRDLVFIWFDYKPLMLADWTSEMKQKFERMLESIPTER
jgi:hypothetical protein